MVVLAQVCDKQQLMRVYGALMWSLGKVLDTPEVTRVYIGEQKQRRFGLKTQGCRHMLSIDFRAHLTKLADSRVVSRGRLQPTWTGKCGSVRFGTAGLAGGFADVTAQLGIISTSHLTGLIGNLMMKSIRILPVLDHDHLIRNPELVSRFAF